MWEWGKKIPTAVHPYYLSYSNMDTDPSGNIYMGGRYSGTDLILGNDTLKRSISAPLYFYVAKYDASGNVLWGRTVDSTDSDCMIEALCTDASGNIYVVGTFGKYIKLGTEVLTVSGSNNYGLFITKYNTNGDLIWARSASSDSSVSSESIVVDDLGNIYIGGSFTGKEFSVGAKTLKNSKYKKSGAGFIVKYDNNGNAIWSQSVGNGVRGITVGQQGELYTCGIYTDSLVAGSSVFYSVKDLYTGFTVKYIASGNVQWAKSIENPSSGSSFIFVGQDAQRNIYLFGGYSGTIKFDSVTLDSSGYLIVKLKENGDVIWAKSLKYGGKGGVSEFCVTPDGRLLIGGFFMQSLRIENQVIHPYAVGTFLDSRNIFLGSINTDGSLLGLNVVPSGKRGADIGNVKLLPQDKMILSGSFKDYILFGNDSLSGPDGYFLAKTTNLPTSVQKYPLSKTSFTVYPNPANNNFHISTAVPYKTVNVYNTSGTLVYTFSKDVGANGYDISGLNIGIYILEVKTENSSQFIKLIKQ